MKADAETQFRELYENTSRNVYAYLRRHCDPELAETVLSEVYLKAWRHFGALTDDPLGWLLTVARTTLLDRHRTRVRRNRLADEFFTVARSQTLTTPEATVVERQAMLTALSQLSEEDRESLLLVGWDGLSHASAASILGCSAGAFAKRLARARQRFEELMDPTAPRQPLALKGMS
ncbi:MAG: sigma-70 family RNA polymerase sigma factor [Propionibacteriaceae bacterium]|nr:sigma-70 family RNA polymerase sigma factor [Propionibacteriaceae bacterium]